MAGGSLYKKYLLHNESFDHLRLRQINLFSLFYQMKFGRLSQNPVNGKDIQSIWTNITHFENEHSRKYIYWKANQILAQEF